MVFLRPILPADRERMLDILTDETVKQTYMLQDFPDREASVPLFNRLMEMSENTSSYVRAIVTGRHLVGFLNHTVITENAIELGYVIHPDSQGRGYMTSALQLAIAELFCSGFRQVTAGAFASNPASLRVMQKAGMHRVEKTESLSYRGNIHRCEYYSIENQE